MYKPEVFLSALLGLWGHKVVGEAADCGGLTRWDGGCVCVCVAAMGALLELTWHDDGFQWPLCEPGTLRAGKMNGDVS